MKKLITVSLSVLLTAFAAALIAFSGQITEDIKAALLRCINVIIPSLFAFMTVSDLMIRSGGYIFLAKPLKPLGLLLKLPSELTPVFLLANTAGYPIGCSMLCRMVDEKRLDAKCAARLLCCCYNGGPAFFSGAVGLAVFGSVRVGMLVFLSIAAANVLAAAILNRCFPIRIESGSRRAQFKAEMISDSVCTAGISLLKICAMILCFQTLITTLRCPGLLSFLGDPNERAVLSAFIEISNLSSLTGLPYRLLPLIAAAGSFGGLCVIMQLYTITQKRFSLLLFFFCRLLCSVLSAGFCMAFIRLFGIKYIAAAASPQLIINFNNFVPSVCLIMMIFLTVLKKRVAFSKKV